MSRTRKRNTGGVVFMVAFSLLLAYVVLRDPASWAAWASGLWRALGHL